MKLVYFDYDNILSFSPIFFIDNVLLSVNCEFFFFSHIYTFRESKFHTERNSNKEKKKYICYWLAQIWFENGIKFSLVYRFKMLENIFVENRREGWNGNLRGEDIR